MAQHKKVRTDTGMAVYFCDPQSPWQRGSNENTNGLLRQYFPKGTDLKKHSARDLEAVAYALDRTPFADPPGLHPRRWSKHVRVSGCSTKRSLMAKSYPSEYRMWVVLVVVCSPVLGKDLGFEQGVKLLV